MSWNVTLGSAITGGTAPGTITNLYDTVVLGAGMVFDWGSGGTAGTAYLQTSFDGGTTWADVAAVIFGTADLNRYVALGQPTFGTAPFTLSSGALTGNTVANIPVGDMARLLYSNVGTYANTTLKFYLVGKR